MVVSEKEIEIIFDIPKWGLFKVLDFEPVEKIMNDPHFVARNREVFSNPYFISRALEGYDEDDELDENKRPKPGKALPFARDYEADGFRFLFYRSENDTVYYRDLDSNDPEEIYLNSIEQVVGPLGDIIRDISENGKTAFSFRKELERRWTIPRIEHFVDKKNFYICDGECIYDVDDYKTIVEELMKITEGALTLEAFDGTDGDETREIRVAINGITGSFQVEGGTDWIDSSFIASLNNMLQPVMNGKRFAEVDDERWGQEFGAVYVDEALIEVLKKQELMTIIT